MRALIASQQCGSSSIPALCHMWIEFVARSRLVPMVFSLGSPSFLSPQEPTSIQIQFEQDKGPAWKLAIVNVGFSLFFLSITEMKFIYSCSFNAWGWFGLALFLGFVMCSINKWANLNLLYYVRQSGRHCKFRFSLQIGPASVRNWNSWHLFQVQKSDLNRGSGMGVM